MSHKDYPQITKLNSSNYSIWKFRMENVLEREDLFEIVDQETPVANQNAAFKKRDRQAKAIICLCIDDSEIIHIKDETSARSTWLKLKSIYERRSLSSKLFLLRKLYSTKLDEGGNMHDHIANMLELVDKLRAIGEDIKQEHIAALLLVSVPKSFDSLITALEARDEAELTVELIKNKLIDEYNKRQELRADRHPTSSHAYKTHEKSYPYKPNVNKPMPNYSNDKFCVYCKRSSHNKDQCYFLKNKNKQFNRNSKKPQRNSNESPNSDNHAKSSVCFSVIKTSKNPIKNKSLKAEKNESFTPKAELKGVFPPSRQRSEDLEPEPKVFDNGSLLNHKQSCEVKCISRDLWSAEIINNELSNSNSEIKNFYTNEYDSKQNSFYLDSGATSHLFLNRNLFTYLDTENESVKIILANGKSVLSQGIGSVKIKTVISNGSEFDVTLENVYFVPELESNLISVRKITEKGFQVLFNKNKCYVTKNDVTYMEATSDNDALYKINCHIDKSFPGESAYSATTCKNKNCILLWHSRLGHRNFDDIKRITKEGLAEGITLDNCKHDRNCVECIKNKITELPYPKQSKYRASQTLNLVHTDLCGPFNTASIGGKYYFLTFVDDYSRFTMIYLLTHKSEVLSKLKQYVAITQNKFSKYVKTLRSDNGGEYMNKEIENFLIEKGIKHQLTVPHSPQQNGVAERKNKSLVEMTRCLLAEGNLSHKFWGEAVTTAAYIQNRLPTRSNLKTPYELWTGRKPDLSHMKTYGCVAFAHIHSSKRGKLDNKATEGILVGYDNRSKGYRIFTSGNQVIISRSVRFIEKKENKVTLPLTCEKTDENEETSSEEQQAIRRSERSTKGKPPDRFSYLVHIEKEPKSYKEILELPETERKKWNEAMNEEIESLNKNETWELVNLPENKRTIGCKWTYKIKINERGDVERYKSRLVAKGYTQKFGIEYEETFAPVVKHSTIRTFLTAACYKQMKIKHVDVKTAFLYGDLKEELYLEQPEGFIKKGNEKKVYKLKKAIYGLKQAAKAWNDKIGNILLTNGFRQSKADPCLFTKGTNNLYIILYVDDLLIAGEHEKDIEEIMEILRQNFEIKDLGEVKYYLGIVVNKSEEGFFKLNQTPKIEELYQNLEKQDKFPAHIPMKTSYQKENEENPVSFTDNKKYRKAIGSLLYIATITRPDITLAVNLLSRKNENPSLKDWEAVKQVIRYLYTTKDLNLNIDKKEKPILRSYTDADWANDKSDRKSTGGNIIFIGNSPIHWNTKKQNCIALSSTESEYIAAAHAGTEIQWLLELLKDIGLKQNLPVTLYEDNKSTIILTQSEKCNNRSKHFDVKFHYIKELVKDNLLTLDYCNSKSNIADIFTKAIAKPQFIYLRDKLNIN